jgi:CRP-like cAMP-binding protein
VKALRDSALVSVSFKFIEDKIANDKNFMAVALKQFSMDWESDIEGLAALSFYTPEQKLKTLFKGLLLSYETDMNTEWLKLPLKLSYNEMATVIYATKCTVIRVMNHWKKLETIRTAKNELLLHRSLLEDVYDWKVTAIT